MLPKNIKGIIIQHDDDYISYYTLARMPRSAFTQIYQNLYMADRKLYLSSKTNTIKSDMLYDEEYKAVYICYNDYLLHVSETPIYNIGKIIEKFEANQDNIFQHLSKCQCVSNEAIYEMLLERREQVALKDKMERAAREQQQKEIHQQYLASLHEDYKNGKTLTNQQFINILEGFDYFYCTPTPNLKQFLTQNLQLINYKGQMRTENKRCRLSRYKCIEFVEMLNELFNIDVDVIKPSEKPVSNLRRGDKNEHC